nr:MAG TPA: hypothetical protein [Bacteriophage sp.]
MRISVCQSFIEDCALPCLRCECGSRRHTLRAVGGVPTKRKIGATE